MMHRIGYDKKGDTMEITILQKSEQPAMKRVQYVLQIAYEGVVPSRKTLQQAVAKKLQAAESLIIIQEIKPIFGKQMVSCLCYAYSDVAAMQNVVFAYIKKRHESKAEKKE
ncbi:MAG: hypothetical protein QW594_01315 [Candidatus Woesearchaeota archaeon]